MNNRLNMVCDSSVDTKGITWTNTLFWKAGLRTLLRIWRHSDYQTGGASTILAWGIYKWCKNWKSSCSKEAVERWRRLAEVEERENTETSSVLFLFYTVCTGIALLSFCLPPTALFWCCPMHLHRSAKENLSEDIQLCFFQHVQSYGGVLSARLWQISCSVCLSVCV